MARPVKFFSRSCGRASIYDVTTPKASSVVARGGRQNTESSSNEVPTNISVRIIPTQIPSCHAIVAVGFGLYIIASLQTGRKCFALSRYSVPNEAELHRQNATATSSFISLSLVLQLEGVCTGRSGGTSTVQNQQLTTAAPTTAEAKPTTQPSLTLGSAPGSLKDARDRLPLSR